MAAEVDALEIMNMQAYTRGGCTTVCGEHRVQFYADLHPLLARGSMDLVVAVHMFLIATCNDLVIVVVVVVVVLVTLLYFMCSYMSWSSVLFRRKYNKIYENKES
jgi:hypothetical protein